MTLWFNQLDIRQLLKSSPTHLAQDAIDEEIVMLNLAKKAKIFEQIATGQNQYLEDIHKN